MRSCAADCYDLARSLSLNGFTVAVRATADRPVIGLAVTCATCSTRYELRPTRPQTVTQLQLAQSTLAGTA